ncbi:MAG: prepilin-type N-terminal cleavage/methylation protein [Conexibacter sp.]|nr:prepilin-type N-terminal cleavage/methylation protein [Conexibacter sp.]
MTARERLRDERGFSLIELLVAMALGSLVLTAVMTVFTTGIAATSKIGDRVDSGSRARIAMDRITTLLDSQVCLRNSGDSTTQPAIPPIVGPSSTGTSVTFYADLSGASDTPSKYTITYDATAKTLTESKYAGAGALPNVTFAATPTTTVLTDAVQPVGTDPIFTYFVFSSDGTVNEAAPVTPSATNQLQIVRVGVKFQANSARTKTGDSSRSIVSGQGIVATADPTDPDLTACSA